MSSPDGVLAAIDSALRDYSVSPDAMRSAPDAPTSDGYTVLDELHIWDARRTEEAAQLWGIDINGTRIYRTSSPPWTTFRVPGEAPREPTAPDAPADVASGGVTTVRFVPDMPDLHAPTVAELRRDAINLTPGEGDVTFYRDDGYQRAWDSPSRTVLISFDFGDRFTGPVTAILERLQAVPIVSREQLARRTVMKTAYRRRRNRR